MKTLSRRKFLSLSGAATAGALLSSAGCSPTPAAPAPVEPTATQPVEAGPTAVKPTRTPYPTKTPLIAPTPRTYRIPDLVKIYPEVKSRVVQARDANVWEGEKLSPQIVRQLVDRSITKLTGIEDVKKAWQALFSPDEKIAIKVNAFRNSTIWTHVELVTAVTDSLVEAGIPGEQITVFDYWTSELETAGFTINRDGPGVRCYGTDDAYATTWPINNYPIKISDILTECDALINMPVLKSHMIAGLTFALKNHYGSVATPDSLHSMAPCLPALSAIPPIKNTTRLVVGDVLSACAQYTGSWPYWSADTVGDSILMSHDPLAHDRVGLDILQGMVEAKGLSMTGMMGQCERWIETCRTAGIGAVDPENYELIEA